MAKHRNDRLKDNTFCLTLKMGFSAYLLNQAAPLLPSEFRRTLLQRRLLVLPNSVPGLDLNYYCSLVLLEKHQLLNSGCYCHLVRDKTKQVSFVKIKSTPSFFPISPALFPDNI